MKWNEIFAQLTFLGQLGLSIAMPMLMSLGACYLLCTRLHVGYLAVTKKETKRKRGPEEKSYNRHI